MEGKAMTELSTRECEACRQGAPPVSSAECQQLLKQIPDWQLTEVAGIIKLRKQYSFADFAEALAFTNRVGEIAEEADHHPELLTEWGKVRVCWWTHTVQGLHLNDFILAAKTDQLSL